MLKLLRLSFTLAGFILVVDCLVLMVFGKINFGTVLPFLIGLIFLAHAIYWKKIRQYASKYVWFNRLWYVAWGFFNIWLISFVIFIWFLKQQINQNKNSIPEVDAVIVLGSGTVNGKPTPTLAKRLDAAVPVIKKQKNALVITSGGVGLGRDFSEAEIMANYLNEHHGIPLKRILKEEKSTSTEENLAFSQPILNTHGVFITEPIAIVTSDFHTIRAATIASHQGYQQPITIASTTPLSIRYNAWFREYFAYISGWLLNEY